MADDVTRPDRAVLLGCVISGIFGIAWTAWGASGLPGGAATVVLIVGIVIGAVIVGRSARLARSAASSAASMFRTRAYRLVVVAEVIAIVGGSAVLGATGHRTYVCAWIAAVVGVHFLAFGQLFHPLFRRLGAALLVAAVAGVLVAAGGGGRDGLDATTGLLAAASLFAAGLWRLFGPAGTAHG